MTRYLAALLVLLAMQFIPGVGMADAQAACTLYASYNKYHCDTREEAYAGALAQAESVDDSAAKYYCGATATKEGSRARYAPVDAQLGRYIGEWTCSTSPTTWRGTMPYWDFYPSSECPAGSTWDEASKTCFSPAQCLSKPALGFSKYTGAVADGACSEGCKFVPDQLGISLGNDDGTWTTYFTGWKPSGEACAVGDPAPTPVTTAQDCKPAPDNQTFCIKPDGQHCYSLTNGSGRQICWRPGEVGEKASDNALQVRNGGTTATTPATTPPPGDSFAQAGGSVTKTATVNGTNVTTTTTNYTTINGTSTGGTDSSEPGDGSGAPSGGGDGEGQGSASGGETCASPPVCSGDPVGCAALAQQYAARCEAKSLFGVEGANTDTGAGMMEDASSLWGDGSGGSGALDEAGFLTAARVCPAPPSFVFLGMDRTIDTAGMCDIAAVVAALVLLIAFAQAAWIIGEQ